MAKPPPDAAAADLWAQASGLGASLRTVTVLAEAPPTDGGEVHIVPTLVAALAGVVRVQTSRAKVDLHPGEAVLIPPGCSHEHAPLKPGAASLAQGFLLGRSDVELSTASDQTWFTMADQPARRCLEAALSERGRAQVALVREALSGLAGRGLAPVRPMPAAVRRMWMYLRRRRLDPIEAGDCIRASGLGQTQAHAIFKAYFGETPLQMLQRHRLDYACHLLRQGRSVTEAAARAGFSSRRHLTAVFTAKMGVSPRGWVQKRK